VVLLELFPLPVAFPPVALEDEVAFPPRAVCDWLCFCCCVWLLFAAEVLLEVLLLFDAEFAVFVFVFDAVLVLLSVFVVPVDVGATLVGVGTQMKAMPSTTS